MSTARTPNRPPASANVAPAARPAVIAPRFAIVANPHAPMGSSNSAFIRAWATRRAKLASAAKSIL
jgi:hypothetical protein